MSRKVRAALALTLLPFVLSIANPSVAQQSGQRTDLPRIDITSPPAASSSPLNTGTVAESASKLGLTPRETPATVEIIDQKTIEERGYRTTTEAAQGAVGVTAGDAPGAPASFSMRGFSGTQINTLYNGIRIGPSEMTGHIMDTGNLDRIEILKGPASLMSGEGATGGAVNYVTKAPHTGPIRNEAFVSFDSLKGYRAGFGSGGSTTVKGLDYRFDVTRANNIGFIDDTDTKILNISGQLNYRVTNNVMVWGAVESKRDINRFYWGTPLVPAAFSGANATSGIVSGLWTQYYPNGHTGPLSPVTIDGRTLKTNYNVLNNDSGAKELWLRGGFDWDLNNAIKLKNQTYHYRARRYWFNSEISAFDDTGTQQVYRERLSVDHDQKLTGNVTDLIWNGNIAGMDNRFAATFDIRRLQFDVVQDDNFTSDFVNLVNPDRGLYGFQQTKPFFTRLDTISVAVEDRLKITPTFAVIGGLRFDKIDLFRTAYDVNGLLRTGAGYPYSTAFTPVTGRIGYTWELLPGFTWYSQYATAADPAVANIFILQPTQPHLLTTSRIYETGVKHLFWDKRAEWTLSLFDIERRNVYSTKGGQVATVAGKVQSQGVEIAAAIRPTNAWTLWGNVAFVDAKYADFVDNNGTVFTGKTPPNVPRVVVNAGTSYRFPTRWPLEVGGMIRHVGDRYNFDDNLVIMNAYTVADAYAFVDIDRKDIPWQGVERARITFRVRNLTDKQYAAWGDPGYPDQILLGAPRSYELVTSFKF